MKYENKNIHIHVVNYPKKGEQKMGKKFLLFILIVITVIIVSILPSEPWRPNLPKVSLTSLYNATEPGTTFIVNITVSDVTNLYLWVINMSWDPSIIKITTGDSAGLKKGGVYYNIYEGSFLKSLRSTRGLLVSQINNTAGTIKALSCGFSTSGDGPSGNGVLASINFTLLKKGTSKIDINGPSTKYPGQCVLQDSGGNEMTVEVTDGLVSDGAPPLFSIQFGFGFIATVIGVIVIILEIAGLVILFRRPEQQKEEDEESFEGIP